MRGFEGDVWNNILWFLLFMFFFSAVYPKLLLYQVLFKLEECAQKLEGLTERAKKSILGKIKGRKKEEKKISRFLEFFTIYPVDLDPYGIVKKLEHISELSKKKFLEFSRELGVKLNEEEKANVAMGLAGAIYLNHLKKIVRHYVELVKKTKNFQLGIAFQAQLPLVEELSLALLEGTKALLNGIPIGDSIGPLVAAHLIDGSKVERVDEETVLAKRKIKGKTVWIVKARGPGSRLGRIGRLVEKLVKKKKIGRIITIDAGVKYEGEITGTVVEGVGVAIGGIGVDRAYVEEIATKKKIPLEFVVIKMSSTEAIQPMKEEILAATPRVLEILNEKIARAKEKNILVVGVGNTCGIGNDGTSAIEAEKKVKDFWKKKKPKKIFSLFGWKLK